MDDLSELNALADNVRVSESLEPMELATERWQRLFSYEAEEAERLILQQRQDLSCSLLSKDLWRLAEESGEAPGHDRESYTHLIKTSKQQPHKAAGMSAPPSDQEYLVKLEGHISSAEHLQQIAGLATTPIVHSGTSTEDEHTRSEFCIISSSTKQAIVEWCAKHHRPPPDFITLSLAPKSFSDISMAPVLGVNTTLPQHRLEDQREGPRPRQDEYPVWYFFYGTLQDPEKLRSIFEGSEDEEYDLCAARVFGGMLKEWGGKYKALVDAPVLPCGSEDAKGVEGKAFLVRSKEQEDALRLYETKAYEVVRCMIVFDDGKEVCGCTFRFRVR